MRNAAWLVLFVSVGVQAAAAQEASDSDARSKIIVLERIAKLQAYESKDLKILDELLDATFLYVDPSGKLQTKGQLMAFVQTSDSFQYVTDEMVVRLHDDTAIVTGLYLIKGRVRGSPYVSRGRFVDTWLNRDGRWVAIASLATPQP